jgi:hypothetical protein
MYYIGTEIQCEEYNTQVCDVHNYHGTTTRWALPIQNYSNKRQYAIIANSGVSSELSTLNTLPNSWYPPNE